MRLRNHQHASPSNFCVTLRCARKLHRSDLKVQVTPVAGLDRPVFNLGVESLGAPSAGDDTFPRWLMKSPVASSDHHWIYFINIYIYLIGSYHHLSGLLGDLFLCSGCIWWVSGFRGVNRHYNCLMLFARRIAIDGSQGSPTIKDSLFWWCFLHLLGTCRFGYFFSLVVSVNVSPNIEGRHG